MRTPIKVNENGDISYFDTIEEAEAYMEPVDVENGEYVVTDADGRPLSASVITVDNQIFFGLFKVHTKKVRLERCDHF